MSALESVLRRDRLFILAALLLLTALAWAYLAHLAAGMSPAMSMPAMDMDMDAMAPARGGFDLTAFFFTFLMWAVMMVGMMAPSAAPTILLYALVGRTAAAQQRPFAATGWFASGYFLAWLLFSLLAAVVQTRLREVMLLTPMFKSASATLSGGVLIVVGLYQWSPFKNGCLDHCRSPLQFMQRHGGFQRQAGASVALGLRHGLYCVGCCWALMLLLFVGGIMNIAWIAALAIVVLVEKLWRHGRMFAHLVGVAAMGAGIFLIWTQAA